MFKNLSLFSGVSLKALYVLASDPFRPYYQREIAEEAQISVGSANRVLPNLVEQELVVKEEKGKIHLYRYNMDDPAARQLKVLFNILELKGLINQIQPHSKRIILYGSCSEGRDAKDSDIDLFILTDDKDAVKEKINRYKMRREISPMLVNANELISLKNRDKSLYDEIQRGIMLWDQEEIQ